MKKEFFCGVCGKRILDYDRDKKRPRKFCSVACSNKSRAKPEEERLLKRFCLRCGKIIYSTKSADKRYCSVSCAKKGFILSDEHKNKIIMANIGKKSNKKNKTFEEIYGDDKAKAIKLKLKNSNKIKFIRKNKTFEEIYGDDKAKAIKLKLSKSQRGKKHKPYTPEYRLKMSVDRKGMKQSLSTILSVIEANKKRVFTEEMRQKHREILTNNWHDENFVKKMLLKKPTFCNTAPEIMMKKILKSINVEFRHMIRIKDIEHSYHVDFLLNDKIVIEVDGKYWHNYPVGNKIDHIRTKELRDAGYKVLRFWENEFDELIVKNKLNKVTKGEI